MTRKEVNLVLRVDLHLAQVLEARALEGMLANEDMRAFRDPLDTVFPGFLWNYSWRSRWLALHLVGFTWLWHWML